MRSTFESPVPFRASLLSGFLLVGACLPLFAQVVYDPNLVVTLPSMTLPANATTAVNLSIQNSGSARDVLGIALYAEVAANGPTISDADILTGTIFGTVPNSGESKVGLGTRLVYDQVSVNSGSVPVAGGSTKLATLYFNTSGITPGAYTYTLDTSSSPTFYFINASPNQLYPTIVPGTLTVVPEPSAYAAAMAVGCLAIGFFVRRSRDQA